MEILFIAICWRLSSNNTLDHLDLRLVLFRYGLRSDHVRFLLGYYCGLLVRHVFASMVLDFEHQIDLLQRKTFGLDVKEPDNWEPGKVENSEDYVESPLDVRDSFTNVSSSFVDA